MSETKATHATKEETTRARHHHRRRFALGHHKPVKKPDYPGTANELDPGIYVWVTYLISFGPTDTPFLQIIVIGDTSVGGFEANTEYWYEADGVGTKLGTNNISFSMTPGSGTPVAPSSGWTALTPQADTPDWQDNGKKDPYTSSGTNLYTQGTFGSIAFALRLTLDGSGLVTTTVWYAVQGGGAPGLISPSGTYTYNPGSTAVTASGFVESIYTMAETLV